MSDEPTKDDGVKIKIGPLEVDGRTAVITAAYVIIAALAVWAAVSICSIDHGGQPVPIPLEKGAK